MTRPNCSRWLIGAVLAALSALGAGGASAQPAAMPDIPKLFGAFQPETGVWSEYAVVEKDTGKRSKMRMAIVGREGESFWYEVRMDDGEHRNIIKMLVRGNPNDPNNIQRLIMKSGEEPAAEMPKDFVAMGRKMAVHMFETRSGVSPETADALRVESGEQRDVVVPAGTFRATLRKILDAQNKVLAEYDFDPKVKPFGVITSDTERSKMELLAYGSDAQTAITETPVRLSGPPGMPEGMPRGMPPGMPGPPPSK